MKKYILIFCSILITCTTPYQSTGFRGGFRDIQIDEDKFIISFQGNG